MINPEISGSERKQEVQANLMEVVSKILQKPRASPITGYGIFFRIKMGIFGLAPIWACAGMTVNTIQILQKQMACLAIQCGTSCRIAGKTSGSVQKMERA